jgi:hypothetical protein
MRLALLSAPLSALALAGCATAPSIPPQAATPFVIEQDLLGRTLARGEFRAINGVRRGFDAELNGAWDGATFTLTEDFVYDDGARDRKTWRLTRTADGGYVGTREDVVGEARGYQDGAAFRLDYKVRLPSENGEGRVVRFRDVMVETADGVVINHANVGLWGLRVARVELTIRRAP